MGSGDGAWLRRAAKRGLLDNLLDRFGAFDSDQFLIEAVVEIAQAVRVEPHLLQHRRVQVLDVEPVGDG